MLITIFYCELVWNVTCLYAQKWSYETIPSDKIVSKAYLWNDLVDIMMKLFTKLSLDDEIAHQVIHKEKFFVSFQMQ